MLNAANEVAVGAYLDEKIKFGQIAESVTGVVTEMKGARDIHTLDGIFAADAEARERARTLLKL